MTRIRARIAERLLEVTQNTAMLTTFNEINMAASHGNCVIVIKENLRKSINVRLGFMSFFVRAVCRSIKTFSNCQCFD